MQNKVITGSKGTYIYRVLSITIALISLISGLLMLIRVDWSSIYRWLFILPIGHAIIIMINNRSIDLNDLPWTRLFVLFGYSIRNVITPLFFVLGNCNYTGVHTIRVASERDLNSAIALMLYETLVLFVGMSYLYSKVSKKEYRSEDMLDDQEIVNRTIPKGLTLYSLAMMIIIAIVSIAYIKVPGIRKAYNSIWTTDSLTLVLASEGEIHSYASGTIDRILYAFFSMFFSILQILLSVQLVYWIKTKMKSATAGLFLSFIVVVLAVTLFVSDSTIFSVYLSIILFIFLRDIYRENIRMVYIIGGSGALVIIIALIAAKVSFWSADTSNGFTMLSSLFNAYFPGVFNISRSFNIDAPGKLSTFCTDLYKSIPLQSLIPNLSSSQKLADYYNQSAYTNYQIIPFVTHAYYYFGLFGPMVQLLFLRYSIKAEMRMNRTNNYLNYIACTTTIVLFGLGIVTYNITSILRVFWKDILPCIILARWSNIRAIVRKSIG